MEDQIEIRVVQHAADFLAAKELILEYAKWLGIDLSFQNFVGINEIKDDGLILFPNTFTDRINITTKRNEPVEFALYDVAGRITLQQSFINSTTINTEQLLKGIYIYEVRNKSGVIKKGKVVKD